MGGDLGVRAFSGDGTAVWAFSNTGTAFLATVTGSGVTAVHVASAAADFVCSGSCAPSRGCRAGSPGAVSTPAVARPVCPVSRTRPASLTPGGPGPPRLPRQTAAMFHRGRWDGSDVPPVPHAGGWRARGRGRGRGERGVRGMRCGTAGGANPACRSTSGVEASPLPDEQLATFYRELDWHRHPGYRQPGPAPGSPSRRIRADGSRCPWPRCCRPYGHERNRRAGRHLMAGACAGHTPRLVRRLALGWPRARTATAPACALDHDRAAQPARSACGRSPNCTCRGHGLALEAGPLSVGSQYHQRDLTSRRLTNVLLPPGHIYVIVQPLLAAAARMAA